jgi:hypothetical protein
MLIQIQLGSAIRSQPCASYAVGVVRSCVNAGSRTGFYTVCTGAIGLCLASDKRAWSSVAAVSTWTLDAFCSNLGPNEVSSQIR